MHNAPLHEHEEKNLFLQESRMLEVLHHPYILPIIDAGINEGLPYIVTEYAPHGSLRQLLQAHAHQPLTQEKALTILAQIGTALQYAHEQKVVHRDLKPENILFNAQGDALLADFGLAITLASMSMHITTEAGTPAYMSPEQFQGVVSREGDQYALGCIAYELFTGQRLFTAPSVAAMMYSHLHTEPTPPSQHNPTITPAIEEAILKALAKERHDRYPDVAAFLVALSAPSFVAEGAPAKTLPAVAMNERLQTLSQAPTLPPFVGTSTTATRLIATKPVSFLQTKVLPENDKNGEQEVQPTQPLLDKTILSAKLASSTHFRRRWLFVALAGVVILAAIVTPFILEFPKAGTKSTLAAVPVSTPQTTPGSQSTQQSGTVVVHGTQTPQSTVTASPSTTATVSATPTGTATLTPTSTSITTPTTVPTTAPDPTAVPTTAPVALQLVVSPSSYSAARDCSWQAMADNGQHGGGTWTCTATLQNPAGTQKTLNWSASSSGTTQYYSEITFAQTSGSLAPGQTTKVSFSVTTYQGSSCNSYIQNSTITFSGPSNTSNATWQCTHPTYTISPLDINTNNCTLSGGQWTCSVAATMYSQGLVYLSGSSDNSNVTFSSYPTLIILSSPSYTTAAFSVSVPATACPGTFNLSYYGGDSGNVAGSLTC